MPSVKDCWPDSTFGVAGGSTVDGLDCIRSLESNSDHIAYYGELGAVP